MNKGNNVTVELIIGGGEIAVDGKFEAVVCLVVDDVAHVSRSFFCLLGTRCTIEIGLDGSCKRYDLPHVQCRHTLANAARTVARRSEYPFAYASIPTEVYMSDFGFFRTHRTWEDWCGMLLGLLIALSPWFPTQQGHEAADAGRSLVILNTVMVGIIVGQL